MAITTSYVKRLTMIRLQSGTERSAGSWTDITYTRTGAESWKYKGSYIHDGRDLYNAIGEFNSDHEAAMHMDTFITCSRCKCIILELKGFVPEGCQLEFDFSKGEKG